MATSIGLTGTTHKAVKVIESMANEQGINHRIDARTIHSALGLKLVQRGEREICVQDKFKSKYSYDILFIDEASMIGDDLFEYIKDCDSKTVIFIGDVCQIQPVNSDYNSTPEDSRVFTEIKKQSNLTEVVRCALDNPIIALATKFRESQDDVSPMIPNIVHNVDKNGHGVFNHTPIDFVNTLVAYFKSYNFKADPDFCRCICYTNKKITHNNKEIMGVEEINTAIRKAIYGNVDEYIVGEIIVAQSGTETYKNAEEFEIMSICDGYKEDPLIPSGVDTWDMSIKSKLDGTLHDVVVIKTTSLEYYNNTVVSYAKLAKKDIPKGLKKMFDPFKHIYCMTAHKAQGSTFDHTFIYTPNFLAFEISANIKKMLYTAITRSSIATHFCK